MKKSIPRSMLPIIIVIALGLACVGTATPTSAPTPEPLSLEEIVAIAEPHTVFIESQFPRDREGSGTGIIFNEDGWIVTNAHVVEGASSIKVHVPDRAGTLSAQLFGVSPCDDLAVIKVTGTGFPKAQFGDSNDLELGREVVVVGYPLGDPSLSVTSGVVSRLHVTREEQEDLIQTNAAVNPGNSGGPLLNMEGEVVGIISFKRTGTAIEGTAFAISSNLANEVVPILTQGKNVNWLGLDAIPLSEIDSSLTEGLWIVDVATNSPADKADLKAGDILVTLAGQDMNSMADLCGVLRNIRDTDELTYGVIPLEEIVGSEPTAIPTETPGYIIVLEDDFSDPTSGWSEGVTDLSTKGYESGKFSILIKDSGVSSWSTRGLSIDDFVLEVEATQIEGPNINAYGVHFRHIDRDNFYRFAISSDGYYAVMREKDGEFEYLVEWTPSPHINRDQRTNHLLVVAEGFQFSFFVNNKHLTDVTDQSFSEGDISLMAASGDEAGVHIHFDNLKVWMEEGKALAATPTLPAATPTPGLTLAFEDDFSGPTCRWDERSDADVEMGCQQNRYRFRVNKAGSMYVSLPTRLESFTDFLIQVQVEQAEGPNSLHGIVFRYQDPRHYYLFAIQGNGYYAILKNEDGFERLVDWTPSDIINRTPGRNSLAVGTVGSGIAVFINDEPVDEVRDDTFPTGGIGLAVGAFEDESGAPLIYFDNVGVLDLSE